MTEDHANSAAKLEELRAKYEKNPDSNIFWQLAEEYRKASRYKESVQVCLTGLAKHPGYTSARMTLARAYLGLKNAEEAKREFERVVATVPDHLLANRHLADIYYEEGQLEAALRYYRNVLMLSPKDPEVVQRVKRLESEVPARRGAVEPVADTGGLSEAELGGPGGADDFMDLKIDESMILNADAIASALGKVPEAPGASRAREEPTPAPASTGLDELGGMDDYSDFSSPTVMLSAAELAKIPGVKDEEEPAAPRAPGAAPRPPADEVRRTENLSGFAARTAEKFGIGRYAPPPVPVEEEPAAREPAAVGEGSGDDLGMMDDYSEFAAPTVMLTVSDLAKAGVLGGDEAGAAGEEAPRGTVETVEEEAVPAEPAIQEQAPAEGFATQVLSRDHLRMEQGGPVEHERAKAAEEAPEGEPGGRTLGMLYLQQGHYEKALHLLEVHLEQHPEDESTRATVEGLRAQFGRGGPRPEPAGRTAEGPSRATPAAPSAAPPAPPPAAAAAQAPPAPADEADKKRKMQKLSSWLSALKKKAPGG